MCKSIKNRKSKICTKPILSSIYIEESNKGKLPLEQIDLEGFETLNKVYNQAWDREI